MISKNLIKLIKSLEQKKYRKREKLFVAEGPKVVGDLMTLMAPHLIIATSDWYNEQQVAADVVANEDEMHRISFLQHPQGAERPPERGQACRPKYPWAAAWSKPRVGMLGPATPCPS